MQKIEFGKPVTCECCGETMPSDNTHDEATVEYKKDFGESPHESECSVVCDDCYKKIMRTNYN